MNLIAKYLSIPILFSLLISSYTLITGKHNQADFLFLFAYGILFYGAPFYLLAIVSWLFNVSKMNVHLGFVGMTLALLIIASLWLLPQDPSGLPIQWMAYWPIAIILSLIFICSRLFYSKLKSN